jgi:hypothetical protein
MGANRRVECGNCGLALQDAEEGPEGPRTPCPSCGSLARHVMLGFAEQVMVRDQLKGKVINSSFSSKKRIRREFQTGSEPRVSRGDHVYKERDIDRDRNRYRELIRDETSGEILRDVDEPLTRHRDHGSAKPALRAARSRSEPGADGGGETAP